MARAKSVFSTSRCRCALASTLSAGCRPTPTRRRCSAGWGISSGRRCAPSLSTASKPPPVCSRRRCASASAGAISRYPRETRALLLASTKTADKRRVLMRNLIALVSLLLAAFAPPAAAAQPATARLPAPVARALAQAGIPETGAAVYVHEIDAEHPVVAHGSDRPLNP